MQFVINVDGHSSGTSSDTASLNSSPHGSSSPPEDPVVALIEKKLSGLCVDKFREPSIFRAHPEIRKADEGAYEPLLVSIGPLHRGKSRLLPMEQIKLAYLRDLIARHSSNNVAKYVSAVRDCLKDAKEHYSEKIELSDEEFVEMLVIDGCFIIEYWAKRRDPQDTPLHVGGRWEFSHLRRDLLLLENQIPFMVLTSIYERTEIPIFGEREKRPLLVELALKYLRIDTPPNEACPEPRAVHHLLHLEHLSLDPSKHKELNRPSYGQMAWLPLKKLLGLSSMLFFGALYLIFFFHFPPLSRATKNSKAPRMIPTATQLIEAGMALKRKKTAKGKKSCQLKVSYRDGTLEIPFLAVDASTGSRLRNLIALEQSRKDFKTYVTSYCVFMDNIINTAGDVAVLQSKGILESKLGSDAEVAELFNGLCKGTHLNYDTHDNAKLFKDVVGFCDFAPHKWRARLLQDYFHSPWATISVLAGFLVLFFTATQTYFAAFARK